MKTMMYHVWRKEPASDPQFPSADHVYTHMFSTTDEAHARHVCNNEDARYVFTASDAFWGELA